MSAIDTRAAFVREGDEPVVLADADDRRPQVLGRHASLDGIRALAVMGVILFHNGFSWMTGGFLGVSTFFTLSGFLITTLLSVERRDEGRIDLRRFWARRFRRLLPAAVLGLAGALIFGVLVANDAQQANLRADVVWATFYGANWHFIWSGSSYAAIFSGGAESPVQHYWSLSIEEQFYLLFPVVLLVAQRLSGGRRSVLGVLLGCGVLVSLTATFIHFGSGDFADVADRIYYGTDTRAAELLAGSLLAVVLLGRYELRTRAAQRAVNVAAVVALGAMLWAWVGTSVTTEWLHAGGFLLYAVGSVLLITSALQPRGPIGALLRTQPLPWIGKVSYGAYLFHWPIFIWLRDETTLLPWGRLAVGLALTFVLAGISHRLVETPIRSGVLSVGWRPWAIIPLLTVGALSATIVVTDDFGGGAIVDYDAGARALERQHVIPGKPRLTFFGDSTMITLASGLAPVLDGTGGVSRVGTKNTANLGCGVGRGGWRRTPIVEREGGVTSIRHQIVEVAADCWSKPWSSAIGTLDPDLAVVMVGPWDVADRWLANDNPGVDGPRFPGNSLYDGYLQTELLAAVDLLAADGARVIWITSPYVAHGTFEGVPPERADPASDPARMDRFNEIVRSLARLRPGQVQIVDFAQWLSTHPSGALTPALKPDGVHFSTEGATEVSREWLAAAILDAVENFRRQQ